MPDLQTELKKVQIALKPLPLTERVWRYLRDNGPKTRKQLTAALNTTTGSISRTVWVLKVEGYVKSEVIGKGLKGEERISLVSMGRPWTGANTPKKGTASTVAGKTVKATALPVAPPHRVAVVPPITGLPKPPVAGFAAHTTAIPLSKAVATTANSTTTVNVEAMTVQEAHALYLKLYKYFGHNHA